MKKTAGQRTTIIFKAIQILKRTCNIIEVTFVNSNYIFQNSKSAFSHVFSRLYFVGLLSDNYLIEDIDSIGIRIRIEIQNQLLLYFRTNSVIEMIRVLSSTLRSLLRENLRIRLRSSFGSSLEMCSTNRIQKRLAMNDQSLR